MQYILTEDEYNKLKGQSQKRQQKAEKLIQDLCTAAAMHVPVTQDWDGKLLPVEQHVPWGCILVEGSGQYCCDLCPAREVCPSDEKEYSQ